MALSRFYTATPPAAMQLKRIAAALGVTQPESQKERKTDPQEAMREAAAAGLGVSIGRPDDPMLDFLDL